MVCFGIVIRKDNKTSFTRSLLADEIPDKFSAERMGHSSTNMLKNVYQHIFAETHKHFSQQINNSFSARLSQANKQMEQHAE